MPKTSRWKAGHTACEAAAAAARADLAAEVERLHQALCDIQFDLINCSQAAGSKACAHLTDAIGIVTRTLAPPDKRVK